MSSPPVRPSYSAVLRRPHVLRTFGPALLGRLSYGTVFVPLAVALTRTTGSYAWAGAAVACFGLGTSALAPLRARLIDRRGPRRVLPVLAVAYGAVLLALTAATWSPGTPRPLLAALTLAAGVCSPPLGPVMRTLWSDLVPDPELRRRAFSLDAVAEEVLYVAGPLLAGVVIAAGNPAAGVGASAVLVVAGTLAMCASPAMRDAAATPHRPAAEAAPPRPGRPAWLVPAVVAGALGVSLGAQELLVVAFARGRDDLVAVAWIQAAVSAGSVLGGTAYGARSWRMPARRRLALLAAALPVPLALAGLANGVYVLAAVLGCTGAFVAPALSTAYLLADEEAAEGARTRAGTWVNSAFNAGHTAGTAATGLALGALPLWLCFVAAAVPTLLSAAPAAGLPGRRAGLPAAVQGLRARAAARRREGWPTGPPPTVPTAGPPVFPCPVCRGPLPTGGAACAACAASGGG
ncbi:MFS transporter [Streptomyces sp. NRRL F-5123]|uniref:MFS transporter n=1 Tax=Streptomyces sp. NRRL F-5123 TaxID=1463856 RepID=UPI0007C453C9|nr:MFS transporter [Streptomyces sp. NRRL F-5123]